jgi:hypothetical protein
MGFHWDGCCPLLGLSLQDVRLQIVQGLLHVGVHGKPGLMRIPRLQGRRNFPVMADCVLLDVSER